MPAPVLFGLVLAGGASTRMGRDKAALAYHGRSQLEWTFELLSEVCAATFVSVRPDQRDEPTRAAFPQLVDSQPGIGPIAGIAAALQQHPKAAWLVVACDLPFITREVLTNLIDQRDPSAIATAYRSAHDGLPEPLCAIWEPSARDPLLAHIASGKQCPRKFLINSETKLLNLPDARALDNINTRDEYQAANASLGAPSTGETGETPVLRDTADRLRGHESENVVGHLAGIGKQIGQWHFQHHCQIGSGLDIALGGLLLVPVDAHTAGRLAQAQQMSQLPLR